MATDVVRSGPLGPELEAVVGQKTLDGFELEIGMVLTLTPVLESRRRLSVRIVGVIEPADLESDYWQFAGVYVDPALLQTNIPVGLEFLGEDLEDAPDVFLAAPVRYGRRHGRSDGPGLPGRARQAKLVHSSRQGPHERLVCFRVRPAPPWLRGLARRVDAGFQYHDAGRSGPHRRPGAPQPPGAHADASADGRRSGKQSSSTWR